ncbi:Hypothetical protein R9X50_00167400 [Acrodontium crateriforme]|uniref:Decapping nuclease n=1 Tax=Acrodontium crateriforme TaxID=150365 RepID=A0AAQ3R818_9PEZI|nr:Hypothetical protein R9X50_00167400 [Acrodontium crateriforme]
MAAINLNPKDRFAGGQTSIRRPREFMYFSFDDKHELHPFSDESISYYYPPGLGTPGSQERLGNLNVGFETFIQRDDTIDEHLDGLLDTLQVYEEKLWEQSKAGSIKLEDVRVRTDVVTWRGMMTKILTALFDDFNEFEMNATSYQDTIFIEENKAAKVEHRNQDHSRPRRRDETPQELMQYWGYKFEALSVLRKPWAEATREEIEDRNSTIVNNNAQFCSIVRTGIGQTSLIIAGEVDAVLGGRPDKADGIIPWVELKTSQELKPNDHKDLLKFERKMLRFWAQSFLLGVPTIAVGFRTPNGHLTRIQELQTQKLPQMVKNSTGAWDGNMCINFTAAFLEVLKATVKGPGVWLLKRRKGEPVIRITKIEDSGTGNILKPSFKAHRERLRAAEIAAALGGTEQHSS